MTEAPSSAVLEALSFTDPHIHRCPFHAYDMLRNAGLNRTRSFTFAATMRSDPSLSEKMS